MCSVWRARLRGVPARLAGAAALRGHALRGGHRVPRCLFGSTPTGRRAPASAPGDAEEAEESGFPDGFGALASMGDVYHRYSGAAEEVPPPPDAFGDEDEESPYSRTHGRNQSLKNMADRMPRMRQGLRHELMVLDRLSRLDGAWSSESSSSGAALAESLQGPGSRRRSPFEFPDDQPVRVRVLDVDALPLPDLHRAFMHTLVRRRPAEVCIHVASRVAQFRDSFKHQAYENLIRDCGRLFGPNHGPELVAMFARCHATISVPYMIDYTRRYGQFSRAFIAAQVERSTTPAFFDFLRYEDKGGVRPLPLIVSRPWALGAYTRLLAKSSLKTTLHEQLKLHGHVPKGELEMDTMDDMPLETRVSERMSAAGGLQLQGPSDRRALRRQEVARPALLEAIMEAEHTGVGWESVVAAREEESTALASSGGQETADDEAPASAGTFASPESRFSMQFEHVVSDEVLEGEDALALRDDEGADMFDEFNLPDRWWGTVRRTFFRHDKKAYRFLEGGWARVPDPRGPRYEPRRRRPSRADLRERKLRNRAHTERVQAERTGSEFSRSAKGW